MQKCFKSLCGDEKKLKWRLKYMNSKLVTFHQLRQYHILATHFKKLYSVNLGSYLDAGVNLESYFSEDLIPEFLI